MQSPCAIDIEPQASTIVLSTLNARYIHASLGLRYLLANMGSLGAQTVLREFTIARPVDEIVTDLLALRPSIIGLGVYIWNVEATTEVVRLIKTRRPEVRVVLGGPEVSHETEAQEIVTLADYVITGWGDTSFAKLCQALLHGPRPLQKIFVGEQPALDTLALPYALYSDADLAHRVVYVEASRGCPFRCEFCLSALDKTAWSFDLERLLSALDELHRRGARNFKFVDRTFNLKTASAVRILEFFLDRLDRALLVHFEVIPDHLPEALKERIARFPAGTLQLEVGVQTFNAQVQQRIARRQDNARTEANLCWLLQHSQAHVHADLIFGLPGETLQSFGEGFDRLVAWGPHEIQLGVLKRLRGTPIARHTQAHAMVYDTHPPYTVVQTDAVDADTVAQFVRLARYWNLVANTGRFAQTLALLLDAPSAFAVLWDWSHWLWRTTEQACGLTPETLVDALGRYLVDVRALPLATVRAALLADYVASGARGSPAFLRGHLPARPRPVVRAGRALAQRQDRHATRRP